MIHSLWQKNRQKDIFRLAILTLITVSAWIGFNTYRSLTASQIAPEVKKQLTPLTPTLDIDTMEKIKQRQLTPPADWGSLKPPPIASAGANVSYEPNLE